MSETDAFDADQRAVLACLLDLLIPPSRDGRLPGAGEVGVGARIDAVAQRDAGLRAVVAAGVAALADVARERGAANFASLGVEDRLAALNAVAAAQPGLLPSLIFHTYVGYYQQGRVLEGLGLEARPPFPKGYALEPFDATLLDAVRRRAKLYRDA